MNTRISCGRTGRAAHAAGLPSETSLLIVAPISTVLLLIWMGFFMMGSLLLLILKHDSPLDSRFIRGLFNVYSMPILVTAAVGALFYALPERPIIALALVCVAGLGFAVRYWFVSRMDTLRSTMTADDRDAIRKFRQLHVGGMLLNVVLLGAFAFGMTRVAL